MAIAGDGKLHYYALNVGQADTNIVITPTGQVIIIDAVRPAKLTKLLNDVGLALGGDIELLVITHPHWDHYSGANRLAKDFRIREAVLAPFWHTGGLGTPSYQRLVERMESTGTIGHYVSGYSRWYPTGAFATSATGDPILNTTACYLEFLGPSNALVSSLERQGILDTNHLSIVCRITWQSFKILLAGDAQMENWTTFDSEEMLRDGATVLKAAHHGSCNGTQWERLMRLAPETVFVSAVPNGRHALPDVVSAAAFAKFAFSWNRARTNPNIVAITAHTGSLRITVEPNLSSALHQFGDAPHQSVNLGVARPLDWPSNPTNWKRLLQSRAASL